LAKSFAARCSFKTQTQNIPESAMSNKGDFQGDEDGVFVSMGWPSDEKKPRQLTVAQLVEDQSGTALCWYQHALVDVRDEIAARGLKLQSLDPHIIIPGASNLRNPQVAPAPKPTLSEASTPAPLSIEQIRASLTPAEIAQAEARAAAATAKGQHEQIQAGWKKAAERIAAREASKSALSSSWARTVAKFTAQHNRTIGRNQ
jgi:hypothetical protein